MNLDALTSINHSLGAAKQPAAQNELRRAAAEFESLLLMQLTSALNSTSNDDEDALFGSDGGTNLAKQMFSEQLAQAMAHAGGVGLADLIVNQVSGNTGKTVSAKNSKFENALAAVKEIKNAAENKSFDKTNEKPLVKAIEKTVDKLNKASLINKSARFTPVASAANSSASNDFEVVSTAAEEDLKYNDAADLPKPIMGDEKLFRYYRPRIVPNYALRNESSDEIAISSVKASTETAKSKLDVVSPALISYQMPVHGKVTSEFGKRFHPIDKVTKFHHGVDIAAPKGTPIAAAAAGKVVFAGWKNGYGYSVVIEHPDGKQTRYGHASTLFVSENETVTAGQKIAAVGSTGKSTGSHLHFEMLENGHSVNPLEFLP